MASASGPSLLGFIGPSCSTAFSRTAGVALRSSRASWRSRSSRSVTSSMLTTKPTARSIVAERTDDDALLHLIEFFRMHRRVRRESGTCAAPAPAPGPLPTPAARESDRRARAPSGSGTTSSSRRPRAQSAEMPVICSSAGSQLLTTSSVSVVRMPIRLMPARSSRSCRAGLMRLKIASHVAYRRSPVAAERVFRRRAHGSRRPMRTSFRRATARPATAECCLFAPVIKLICLEMFCGAAEDVLHRPRLFDERARGLVGFLPHDATAAATSFVARVCSDIARDTDRIILVSASVAFVI